MCKTKHYTTLFFLSFFIFIKTGEFCHIAHHDDTSHTDCDTCEYLFSINQIPLEVCNEILIKQLPQHLYNKEPYYKYTYIYTKNYTKTSFFSRPPPTV